MISWQNRTTKPKALLPGNKLNFFFEKRKITET